MERIMLNISKLTLGYEDKVVLEFNGLKLTKGDQCLLTGPSGCGKTTLLYAIAGINNVINGQIVINGVDISELSEARRDKFRSRNIGIIFQTLHLVKSLSVFDNLMLSLYLAGLPQESKHIDQLLETLGIADKKSSMPSELSQGQAQRLAIARAVLKKPSLILADEPTSSLDDKSCQIVINLIKQVASDFGATLLISTHDSRVKGSFKNTVNIGG